MPPASDTTSGRDATANRARTSDAVMPAARAAYRSTKRSIENSAIEGAGRVGKCPSVAALYRSTRQQQQGVHGPCWRPAAARRAGRPTPDLHDGQETEQDGDAPLGHASAGSTSLVMRSSMSRSSY